MDPIADMFAQIQNAQMVDKKKLEVPFSKTKMAILAILKNSGKIIDFHERQDKNFKKITIDLAESKSSLKRISHPGRRVYADNGNIPVSRSPEGLIIVSTSSGMMTGEEARKKGLGGEIIAEAT